MAIANSSMILRGLRELNERDLAELMHPEPSTLFDGKLQVGRPNALTSLRDACGLREALIAFRASLSASPAHHTMPAQDIRASGDLPSGAEVLQALATAQPFITSCCQEAGLGAPEMVPRVQAVIRSAAMQLNGQARNTVGKERGRILVPMRSSAITLIGLVARSGKVSPSPDESRSSEAFSPSAMELLQDLLVRLVAGIDAMLGAMPTRGRGCSRAPDAIHFGVEALLTLWCAKKPATPPTGGKRGGFLALAEDCLGVAVRANGSALAFVHATTIRNVARQVIRNLHAAEPRGMEGPEELQARAASLA